MWGIFCKIGGSEGGKAEFTPRLSRDVLINIFEKGIDKCVHILYICTYTDIQLQHLGYF